METIQDVTYVSTFSKKLITQLFSSSIIQTINNYVGYEK
uniref:Uncharacterized protein n=1 Tax=viral metagenome TaxID=1070528 RepID=A0A6C0C2A1_9ZZZZ